MSDDSSLLTLQVHPNISTNDKAAVSIASTKHTTAKEVVKKVLERLGIENDGQYVLAEMHIQKEEEKVLAESDLPAQRMYLWPRQSQHSYKFVLREVDSDGNVLYKGANSWQAKANEESTNRSMAEKGFLSPVEPSDEDFPDLCALSAVSQKSVLDVLKMRFLKDKIYTYTANILISINPYRFLPIYNPRFKTVYQNRKKEDLEPHIYAIADNAFHRMVETKKNQCIVITGKSGSGKTQATHFLVHHTLALCQKSYMTGVEHMLIGCGPVLEAFGNSLTEHNNNSSRFGKFLRIYFYESGLLSGADIQTYLLEKSRLVHQGPTERNFHIFYYLLCGSTADELSEMHLDFNNSYNYVKQDNLMNQNEARSELERLRQAMEVVGFFRGAQTNMFKLCAAILLIGNITFRKVKRGRDDSLEIENETYLFSVSKLLGLDSDVVRKCLLTRKAKAGAGERFILDLKLEEANATRDAMAKALYQSLFDWTVNSVNMALAQRTRDSKLRLQSQSIGLLDIFGFEDFASNSFEQFCINYVSEHLQHYCIKHTFQMEQEAYKLEGIEWKEVDYADNSGCLSLYEKKPTGLFYLVDENFPGANNQTLLQQFNRVHHSNKYYQSPAVKEDAFIICHYAGKVKYRIKNFREKNHDQVREDIITVLRASQSSFVQEVISKEPAAVFRWSILRAVVRAASAFRGNLKHKAENTSKSRKSPHIYSTYLQNENKKTQVEYVHKKLRARLSHQKSSVTEPAPSSYRDSMYGRRKAAPPVRGKKKSSSIGQQYQTSLAALMTALEKADPFFIRCIQPNSKKVPLKMDDDLVMHQLRCSGTMQTIQLQQSRYTERLSTQKFAEDYKLILPPKFQLSLTGVEEFLQSLQLLQNTDYQVGKTQIFLRDSALHALRAKLHKAVLYNVVLIQACARGYICRRDYLIKKEAAIKIQSFWRMCETQTEIEEWHLAASIIQDAWHDYRDRKFLKILIQIQASCRGYLVRKRITENKAKVMRCAVKIQRCWRSYSSRRSDAVLLIQKHIRGLQARKKFNEMKKEKLAISLSQFHVSNTKQEDGPDSSEETVYTLSEISEGLSQSTGHEETRCDDVKNEVCEKVENVEKNLNEELNNGLDHHDDDVKTVKKLNDSNNNFDEIITEKYEGNVAEPDTLSREKVAQNTTEKFYGRELQAGKYFLKAAFPKQGSSDDVRPVVFRPSPRRRRNNFEKMDTLRKTKSLDFCSDSDGDNFEVDSIKSKTSSYNLLKKQSSVIDGKGTFKYTEPSTQTDNTSLIDGNNLGNTSNFIEDLSDKHKEISYAALPSQNFVDFNLKNDNESNPALELENVEIEFENKPTNYSRPILETTFDHKSNEVFTSFTSQIDENHFSEETDKKVELSSNDNSSADDIFASTTPLSGLMATKQEIEKLKKEWLAFQTMERGRQIMEFDRNQQDGPRKENKQQRKIREEITNIRLKEMEKLKEKMERLGVNAGAMPMPDLPPQGRLSRTVSAELSPPVSPSEQRNQQKVQHNQPAPQASQTIIQGVKSEKEDVKSEFPRSTSMESIAKPLRPRRQRSNSVIESYVGSYNPPSTDPVPRKFGSLNDESFAKKCIEKSSSNSSSSLDFNKLETGKSQENLNQMEFKRGSAFMEAVRKTFWGSSRGQNRGHTPAEKRSSDGNSSMSGAANSTPTHGNSQPVFDQDEILEVKVKSLEEEQFSPKLLVTSPDEIILLQNFIKTKTKTFDGKTLVDHVFRASMNEFCENLTVLYSTTKGSGNTSALKYNYIVTNFRQVLEKTAKEHSLDSYAAIMAVNGFRGYMNEFTNNILPKFLIKEARLKKKKAKDDTVGKLGHVFAPVQWGITQVCEVCGGTMLLMDVGLTCKTCKFACHKKCLKQLTTKCSVDGDGNKTSPKRLFNEPLINLVSEESLVPIFIDKCISYMELNGIYQEGIYRKSAASTQNKHLEDALNKDIECQKINFDEHNIHSVASCFKKFLRSLPHPLVPYDKYHPFLQAARLTDEREKVNSLFSVLEGIPPHNHATLERIMFHLARVAQQEPTNRMSPKNLAIVFTPCFFTAPSHVSQMEVAQQVADMTNGVETIIAEQVGKIRSTLEHISQINSFENTTNERLQQIRKSMGKGKRKRIRPSFREGPRSPSRPRVDHSLEAVEENQDLALEEQRYQDRIATLRSKKESLTSRLPALTPHDPDQNKNEIIVDGDVFQYPVVNSTDVNEHLRHLNKHRTTPPKRRRPSKYKSHIYEPKPPLKEGVTPLRRVTAPKGGKLKRLVSKANLVETDSFTRSSIIRNPIHRPHKKRAAASANRFAQVKMTSV